MRSGVSIGFSPNLNFLIHSPTFKADPTEVQVALTNPGPDYVFEPTYALPTLEAVKTYIDENKHLPEIPSAKEMEKNGVKLGEMNMLLLKKIEELTLYILQQENRINELEKASKNSKK